MLVADLGPVGRAAGEERISAGTRELTLSGAYGLRHATGDAAETDALQLLPHFGYFPAAERGPGWLRGTLEVLVEPTLVRLDGPATAWLWGLGTLTRWVFTTSPRIHPYVEAGVGVLWGRPRLPESNCGVNFVLQGGAGALLPVTDRTAITLGYRLHHISNGNACEPDDRNVAINSSLFLIGLTYFFP